MANGQKLVFFGNERLATGLDSDAPIFRALIAEGYEITALIVAQRPQKTASRNKRTPEILAVAESHGIHVLAPEKLSEASEEIKALDTDIAVLVAYGKIIPKEILKLFPQGIINIHPSLLPKHRGPTPIESAILNGDKETGVSIMQLVTDMDAGPVFAQKKVSLHGTETKRELADKLIAIGKGLLLDALPNIIDGSLQPQDQNSDEASYDSLIEKSVGVLDFHKDAATLDREVRAYGGWPKSRCKIGLQEVVITKAHVVEAHGVNGTLWLDGTSIGIFAAKDVLVFDTLKPAGKKEMDARSFMAGYHPAHGTS